MFVAPGVDLLKITSSGSWTVELRPVTSATQWIGTAALAGKGDSVVVLTGGSFTSTTITNKSSSGFAVIAYGLDGSYLDLLVNEIGSSKGEVLLPSDDPVVLSVHDVGGSWTMSAVQ